MSCFFLNDPTKVKILIDFLFVMVFEDASAPPPVVAEGIAIFQPRPSSIAFLSLARLLVSLAFGCLIRPFYALNCYSFLVTVLLALTPQNQRGLIE